MLCYDELSVVYHYKAATRCVSKPALLKRIAKKYNSPFLFRPDNCFCIRTAFGGISASQVVVIPFLYDPQNDTSSIVPVPPPAISRSANIICPSRP